MSCYGDNRCTCSRCRKPREERSFATPPSQPATRQSNARLVELERELEVLRKIKDLEAELAKLRAR